MAYDWALSVEDVGTLLRARTVESETGVELGTFTDETRPTSTAVQSLIDAATDDVVSAVGGQVPQGSEVPARRVAALGAALLVELSYYPEQIETGQSPYQRLKELYDARLTALIPKIEADTGTDVETGASGMPLFGFPVECRPLGQARW